MSSSQIHGCHGDSTSLSTNAVDLFAVSLLVTGTIFSISDTLAEGKQPAGDCAVDQL